MSQAADSEFGTIRSFLWPIHHHELKKFLPMQAMLFLICFNYSILRNLKDAIVITASGAEIIPFIKVWGMLPMAVVITVLFTKLSNRYSQERVFYIMISGFLTFFALFAFVLYPLRDTLHPHAAAKALEEMLPGGKWLIAMGHNWIFTSFYILAELWGSMVLSVLFWGFANEVTRISEAHRFYSVFSIGSNIAASISGLVAVFFLSPDNFFGTNSGLDYDKEAAWEKNLTIFVSVIIVSGIAVMAIFRWVNRNVLTDPRFEDLHKIKRAKGPKAKLSLRESFFYLSNSRYLLYIAVIVISYNLVINLVEVVWKDQLRMLYPSNSDYMTYMSYLTFSFGLVSTITAFFMSKILTRFGWTRTALITPVIMLVTSVGFFSFMFFRDSLAGPVITLTGLTPLAIAVFFGSAQNCLSKAAKYSVFDATKEMAFIPLSHESKLKGKAAIDGVGSRLGKSGGSLIHSGLLMITTLSTGAPYVAAILMGVIIFWIFVTRALGRKFNALVASQQEEAHELFPERREPIQEITAAANPAIS